jgi:hypothetical protein
VKAKTGRKLEMGARALIFSRVHPDPSSGYAALLAHLEDRLARATHLAGQQRDGIIESHRAWRCGSATCSARCGEPT